MDWLTNLANAPVIGLLMVVIILLVLLNTYLVRSAIKGMTSDKRESARLVDDMRIELAGLRAQMEMQERLGTATFERAIKAEVNIDAMTQRNKDDKAEIADLKFLLTRTQARVIQLVNVMIASGIVVPPEASIELQAAAVQSTPKKEGAEPLSSDIDAAQAGPNDSVTTLVEPTAPAAPPELPTETPPVEAIIPPPEEEKSP